MSENTFCQPCNESNGQTSQPTDLSGICIVCRKSNFYILSCAYLCQHKMCMDCVRNMNLKSKPGDDDYGCPECNAIRILSHLGWHVYGHDGSEGFRPNFDNHVIKGWNYAHPFIVGRPKTKNPLKSLVNIAKQVTYNIVNGVGHAIYGIGVGAIVVIGFSPIVAMVLLVSPVVIAGFSIAGTGYLVYYVYNVAIGNSDFERIQW